MKTNKWHFFLLYNHKHNYLVSFILGQHAYILEVKGLTDLQDYLSSLQDSFHNVRYILHNIIFYKLAKPRFYYLMILVDFIQL